MIKTIYICDRCGKEVESSGLSWVKFEDGDTSTNTECLDVCNRCRFEYHSMWHKYKYMEEDGDA